MRKKGFLSWLRLFPPPAPFGEILFTPFIGRIVFRHAEDFLVARVVPSVAMLVHLGHKKRRMVFFSTETKSR